MRGKHRYNIEPTGNQIPGQPTKWCSYMPEVDEKLFHCIKECANCYIHAKCERPKDKVCKRYRLLREPVCVF